MNWYKLAIYSNVEITAEDLTSLYELHYKYQILQSKPFIGHYKRKDNLIRKIEEKAMPLTDKIITGLSDVYMDWLSKHALTDPESWAESRVQDLEDPTSYTEAIHEFARYYSGGAYLDNLVKSYGKFTKTSDELLKIMLGTLAEKSTILSGWTKLYKDDEKQRLDDDYQLSEDKEDYEEKLKYIESMDDKEVLEYLLDNFGASETMKMLVDYDADFIKEIYQYSIFPVWYNHWKAQGIDKTRKMIEGIYNNLLSAINKDSLPERFKVLNLAIQASHQTGDMMDYIEQKHGEINKELLDNLSNRSVDDWNEELKAMGVQI